MNALDAFITGTGIGLVFFPITVLATHIAARYRQWLAVPVFTCMIICSGLAWWIVYERLS